MGGGRACKSNNGWRERNKEAAVVDGAVNVLGKRERKREKGEAEENGRVCK